MKSLSHDGDDRSDTNIFQNAPVIPRVNAISALRSKKCVPKWHNKQDQAIGTIIWKHNRDGLRRTGRSGRSRSLGSLQVLSGRPGAIVKICKRLNGNHSRMTRTIEAIQTYPKMHRLFQDSMLFLHCVPKNAFQTGTTNVREWRRSSCTSVWYSKRQNFRINPYFIMHILF